MPYIKPEFREGLNPTLDCVHNAAVAGELNFQFTMLMKRYLDDNGKSYQTINDIMGALEGAKQEFYRRVAVPFEEEAIKRNGDIY